MASTCGAGFDDCDCDVMTDGTVMQFCECHDCHVCGEIECVHAHHD